MGLYDYTAITHDPLGLKLFEAGDAEARAEVPHYDTGYWSLYDQYGESNLNYHELLTEFLQHLCERTRKGPPPTGPTTPTPTPTPPTRTTPPASSTTGGSGAPRNRPRQPPRAPRSPGDQIYCTTAQKFTEDLKTPPAVSLLSTRLRGGTRAGVTISLSKISTVSMTIRRGSKTVWTTRATVGGGRPKLLWVTPTTAGSYSVTLTASDLAGNFSTAHGTILLSSH